MYHIIKILCILCMYKREREREKKKQEGAWTFARFASLPRCFVDFLTDFLVLEGTAQRSLSMWQAVTTSTHRSLSSTSEAIICVRMLQKPVTEIQGDSRDSKHKR